MTTLMMSLFPFWTRTVYRTHMRALRLNLKYLKLCSEDERRSYGFGPTWRRVINDIIFIFGWTNPLIWEESKSGGIFWEC